MKSLQLEEVRTAPQYPWQNAFAERWVRSIKTEILNRMILVGEQSHRRALSEFCAHYHEERPHQGLDNNLIHGCGSSGVGEVIVNERLGGILKHYYRAAA